MEGIEPQQYWIRNGSGNVWGPLAFATIELLIENGMLQGRLEVSRDGIEFVPPGRLPDVRDAFPRELWGESAAPARAGPPVVGGPPTIAPSAPRSAAGAAPAPAAVPPRLGPTPAHGTPRPTAADAAAAPPPPVVDRAAPGAPVQPRPTPATTAQHTPPVVNVAAPPVARPTPPPVAPPRTSPTSAGAPTLVGELAASGVLKAWYQIAAGGLTGRLSIEGARTYAIYFRKGFPEAVASSEPGEDFGEFAVKRGLLQPTQLVEARAMLAGFGGEIVNVLFGMRLINPAEAFQLLAEHAVSLLPRALAMEAGRFSFDPAATAPATAMPLGDRWKLIADVIRAWPLQEIRRRLGPALDRPVMRSGGKVELADLRLTAQEARVVGWFDGVRSLEALTVALPADAENILRVAFLLSIVEAVAFAAPSARPAATQRQPTPPPAQPKPSAPVAPPPTAVRNTPPPVSARPTPPPVAPKRQTQPPVARPTPPADLPGDDLPKLRAYVEKLAAKNHFEVLGVQENVNGAQVKVAYFGLAKSFHPDTVPPGAPPELAKLKADAFARIGEAYRVLADDASRATYLDELKSGGSELVDVNRILGAEECFQKGCILVRARKFPEAVAMLDEAISLNDQEGEYYAWRAWARFAAAPDKARAKDQALREIDSSIRMNPRCAMGYYFAGQITKLLGDAPGAEKWFKKTLSVDANHLDAQRELRLLASRK